MKTAKQIKKEARERFKRVCYFSRTLIDFIPILWKISGSKYYDVWFFHTSDSKDWKEYKKQKLKIAKIIDPNYKPN